MNETFFQRSERVRIWLQENLSPWIEKNNIHPGVTVGGLCLYLATYTLSVIPIEKGDITAMDMLQTSFDYVRRKIQDSGIAEPVAPFGARGTRG